jgi:hypothetical protein
MAITNAQQYKQLVNPPMKGNKRPGYRGDDAYGGGSYAGGDRSNSPGDRGDGPATGAQFGSEKMALEKGLDVKQQPKGLGLGNFALSLLSGATDLPFSLMSKFKNAPDFDPDLVPDFGRANQKSLFPIIAQGPRTMDTMPTEEEEETPFKLAPRFAAEGGSMNDEVVGGEMDFESARQMYGLGKLVKKVTRTVKKIAKSPVGKAAIAYGLYQGYQNPAFKKFLFGTPGGVSLGGNLGRGAGIISRDTPGLLGVGGKLTKMGALKGILGLSTVAGLTAEEQENETVSPEQLGPGLNIPQYRRDPFGNLAIRYRAEGGSTEQKEPVAKKTMPLLNMGGMEKDYREDGGFVPIGRMEKADDVPARLSKNEFVFTADAVRNAGEGDVDKGAEVMYNMMKNLEAGGEVSEESQGLEGARRMFQTSQRLEEVL